MKSKYETDHENLAFLLALANKPFGMNKDLKGLDALLWYKATLK